MPLYDKSVILFDLDGTLSDPKEGITKSFQYALNKMGLNESDPQKLLRVIGPPLWDSFEEFYSMSRNESQKAVEYYRERFGSVGLYENRLIPGIEEFLHELKQRGKRLAVATSKPTFYSEKIIRHFGLESYFEQIVGAEMDGSRVRKEDIISYALTLMNASATECVMVGDRSHDIVGAKKNNVVSVGVLFGYGSREELLSSGADFIAETVGDLRKLLIDMQTAVDVQ